MKRLKAVLFDHDGTLVHSEPTHLAMWRKAVEPYGGYVTDEEYWTQLLGVPAEENAEILIALRGLGVDRDTLVAKKLAHTAEYLSHTAFPAVESATKVLTGLFDKVALALVSGSQRFCIEASLREHGWSHYFGCVVTGDDVTRNKPYPDSYRKALACLNVEPDQCVAIEDTQSGVRAAAAAGIPVIAIRNEFSENHDFSAAVVEVSDLGEACQYIVSLLDK